MCSPVMLPRARARARAAALPRTLPCHSVRAAVVRSYRVARTLAPPLALLSCPRCDPCQFSILSSPAPASHARPLRCRRCPPRVGRRCRALTPGSRPSVCIVIAAVLRPGHHSCRCCCGTLPSILFAGACACALPTHPRAARVGCRPASAPVRLRTVRRCVGVRHVAAATHMRVCTATVASVFGIVAARHLNNQDAALREWTVRKLRTTCWCGY